MPGYKTHIKAAAYSGALLITLFYFKNPGHQSLPTLALYELASILGALFPDIDISSKGQKWYYLILAPCVFCALIYKSWFGISILSFLLLFPPLLKHRGITHELWFIISVPLIPPLILTQIYPTLFPQALTTACFFIWGSFTHLVLDYGLIGFLKRR